MTPYMRNIYGSGGRAAVALSRLDHGLKLYSYASRQVEKEFSAIAHSCKFDFSHTNNDQKITFSYIHPLSIPTICPHPLLIKKNTPISIAAEIVLRYGMLEGDAIIDSQIAVYDPQDAYLPKMFHDNGSKAGKLAVILNKHEGNLLTGLEDEKEIVAKISHVDNASVVVLKMGPRGALVYESGNYNLIPCFQTNSISPIGSGDIFSAVFAFEWAKNKKKSIEAAENASGAVAEFCKLPALPLATIRSPTELGLKPIAEKDIRKKPRVYLAGPFFTLSQLWMIEEARNALIDLGLQVFSPYHDIGEGAGVDVAPKDIKAIRECDILFAILSGQDPGTIFEIGFAKALDKPVIVFVENEKEEDLKMIEGSGCYVFNDFVAAVYNTRWMLW
ncbi:PfkB family carbohydrate kinase [Solidesulfovibrio carbinoliphilus]|nr:PfkB family carbohydrate kinase [Solidesulfovibrio carbinoliphilus]